MQHPQFGSLHHLIKLALRMQKVPLDLGVIGFRIMAAWLAPRMQARSSQASQMQQAFVWLAFDCSLSSGRIYLVACPISLLTLCARPRLRLGGLLERLHERLQVKPFQTFVL